MSTKPIIQRIQSVIGPCDSFTPLHIPIFDEQEVANLRECVESNFVSSVGAFCDRFEEALCRYTGAKRAVLCVNGTAALHLALRVVGVQAGDEVLIPSLSFVATANALSYAGAVPHFIDVESQHFGMCPQALKARLESIGEMRGKQLFNRETNRPIRCVVPMHAFGHPVLLNELLEVSRSYGLLFVEDAAESLGSFYRDQHTGTFGDCGIVSFNGNKIITTGGGGVLLFNDEKLADHAKHLSTTAKRPHKWEFFHDELGYNYRMPALNAALGCAQMEKMAGFVEQKRELAARYAEAFSGMDGLRFVTEPKGCRSNYWLNTLVLEENGPFERDAVLDATNAANIMTRPVWNPLHQLPMYEKCPRADLPITLSLARRIVNIPSTAGL
jgi:perosamine synthetase